jgi:hypothetical protein
LELRLSGEAYELRFSGKVSELMVDTGEGDVILMLVFGRKEGENRKGCDTRKWLYLKNECRLCWDVLLDRCNYMLTFFWLVEENSAKKKTYKWIE